MGCALCPRESLGLSLESTSRLAASDPSLWPAPCGQHIKGANTSVFFLLLTIITMAIPEQNWVRGKLPSRSQGLLLLQKQGFLYFFGILSSRGVREQGTQATRRGESILACPCAPSQPSPSRLRAHPFRRHHVSNILGRLVCHQGFR